MASALFDISCIRVPPVCTQEVSINKYFDDAMLLELAKHEADREMME
jgi:hypothetical protein